MSLSFTLEGLAERGVEGDRRLLILGSGPAGCTAAVYASREGVKPLVLEGPQPGGQLTLTGEVENFPGFPQGIRGPELMALMKAQAKRFGAEFLARSVTSVDFKSKPFKIYSSNEEYTADAVIIATGSSARWLGLESEQRLIGRGVSSCAVCDGPLFRGKSVVVVGGGNTALEEALTLAKLARRVTVVHRRDRLRASRILQERAFREERISFLWNSVVREVLGEDRVRGVLVEDLKSGERRMLECDGVFIAIGHKPNTEVFRGALELDEEGYIVVKDLVKTSVEGVFAAGDVVDKKYRQAVTAAALGCIAALEAVKYLETVKRTGG